MVAPNDRGRPDQDHAQKRRRGQEAPGRRRLPDRPEALAAGTQPVRVGDAFNAVGHFRLAPNGEAWATEAPAGQAPTKYNAVRRIADVTGRAAATATIVPLSGLSGRDDIAVFRNEDGAPADTVYAVAETSSGTKFLLGFRGTTEIARIPLEQTALRLEVVPRRRTRCSSPPRTASACASST